MNIITEIIKEDFPNYYDYIKDHDKPSSFYFGNMSVMKNDLFEEYCTFLFGVLEKVEQILIKDKWYIDLHHEKVFSRKLGYFGEYLTDVFIRKKLAEDIRIKELNIAVLNSL